MVLAGDVDVLLSGELPLAPQRIIADHHEDDVRVFRLKMPHGRSEEGRVCRIDGVFSHQIPNVVRSSDMDADEHAVGPVLRG